MNGFFFQYSLTKGDSPMKIHRLSATKSETTGYETKEGEGGYNIGHN